jgi:hypothetical protein
MMHTVLHVPLWEPLSGRAPSALPAETSGGAYRFGFAERLLLQMLSSRYSKSRLGLLRNKKLSITAGYRGGVPSRALRNTQMPGDT